MLIGDPNEFAIEFEIFRAFESKSLLGLGYFVIYLGGVMYGVRKHDATALAVSFDEVGRRLEARGTHSVSYANADAHEIADAVRVAIYCEPERADESFFGRSRDQFDRELGASRIQWAPDGDEAFDDGSHILQLDVGDRVRLIGFRFGCEAGVDSSTVRDIWIGADRYYSLLSEWRAAFMRSWTAAPKEAEA